MGSELFSSKYVMFVLGKVDLMVMRKDYDEAARECGLMLSRLESG